MSSNVEFSQVKKEPLSAVVLDRDGIIRAADFNGLAFDGKFGWPADDLIGRPFMSIHEEHNIEKNEISRGVGGVCRGNLARFAYQFELDLNGKDQRYELFANPESPHSENILVTYRACERPSPTLGIDLPRPPARKKVAAVSELLRDGSRDNTRDNTRDNKRLVNHTNIHEALFEHVPSGILYQNNRGMIELANPAAQKILGLSQDELKTLTRDSLPWELFDENNRPLAFDALPSRSTLKTGKANTGAIFGVKKKSGQVVWIKANTELVKDTSTGEQTGVLTSFVDITSEIDTRNALQAQTERTQIAVESAEMGVWDWLPDQDLMQWDKKLFQLYGYRDDSSVSPLEAWKNAIHPDDQNLVRETMLDLLRSGSKKCFDYRVVWQNGSIHNLRSQARVITDSNGKAKRVIGVTHDVTNAIMAEKKLWELAYTDNLTGAYSRAGLNFRISRTIAHALQHERKFCVLMMGLARFKEINENYGLSVGDRVLVEVARRAQKLLQPEDTVARVGGDEFILVMESLTEEKELQHFADYFRREVLTPVYLNEGLVINLEANIGASIFPDDGGDAPTLQTNAGLAMRTASVSGGESLRRYSQSMSEEVARRFNLKYQLFSAVKSEEFQLYYQPIIDLKSNKVIGCEALLRWKDNHGRFVSPMEFIPVIEESGLIYELGNWINLTAVRQWKMWQHLVPDLKYISVNVSPRQLENANFFDDLVAIVEAHDISPRNLQLEITEGTFLQETLNADGALHRLASYGFRLAIDDFGTGYSSLAYLKRFNVDVIKIDRSFIKDIETDESDRDIVSAILAMNKKLGFKTLVEGVETDKQNQIVHELGCDSAQGYLYGKPTFADEFAENYIQKRLSH